MQPTEMYIHTHKGSIDLSADNTINGLEDQLEPPSPALSEISMTEVDSGDDLEAQSVILCDVNDCNKVSTNKCA